MTTTLSAETIAQAAKAAFESAQVIPASERVRALSSIKTALEASKAEILAANKIDLDVRLALYLRECAYL
jgi:glutamate-5-semialdehyde dehydrogenase